jgi:2-oxoglutarate dehydrogenase E2 component (dihydrolipoamide succinyltransferase)
MRVPLRMPRVGESVNTGVIATWLKKPGDAVTRDEPVVSVETDKATVDVPAPATGVLATTAYAKGAEVKVEEVLAEIETDAAAPAPAPAAPAPEPVKTSSQPKAEPALSPSVRRIVEERGLDAAAIAGTGPGGRLLKEDVLAAPTPAAALPQPLPAPAPAPAPAPTAAPAPVAAPAGARVDRVVPMTPLRKRLAERLLQAQSTAAMLTTFNEVDMSRAMELRAQLQEQFTKKHGVKLGFMSFFVKACVQALREFPGVNGEIRGGDIVYHDYYDIGVAVGGGRGLVVPVLRDADRLSFADVEKAIADFGARAKDNRLKLEELQGGTFTISNGGVYGSMMSTPILNPPQSGILGMHNIVKRAVVVDDQIVVRPMMYLALSYDHRLVDGREAVSFLVRVKECIEKPERLLFEV